MQRSEFHREHQARLERALHQRLCLLGWSDAAEGQGITAEVLGTSERVYKVSLRTQRATCTCPDYCRRWAVCKHILFIVARVCGEWQEAEWLKTTDIDQRLIDRLRVRLQVYRVAESLPRRPREGEGDPGFEPSDPPEPCPICFEDMDGAEPVRVCRSHCRRWFHTDCVARWLRRNRSCPTCRGSFEAATFSTGS